MSKEEKDHTWYRPSLKLQGIKLSKKAIAILIVALGLVGIVSATYYYVYHMSGTVGVNETVVGYLDSACSVPLPDNRDWGNVSSGDTKEIWFKNEGNVQVDVTLTVTGETDCTVTLDISSFTLSKGATRKVTLTISTSATGGTAISWDLDVSSRKS